MKIIDNRKKDKTQFQNLIWGLVFQADGKIWIRVKQFDKAIDLETGVIKVFQPGTMVEPLDVELHIVEREKDG